MGLPYNIVLVVVDTLRRDSLGSYDPGYRFTPRLDERLQGWHRFDRCYGSAPWTLPAISSILSGIDASRHGRFVHTESHGEPVSFLLPERHRKVGVVNNANLMPGAQGFDAVFDDYTFFKAKEWRAPFDRALDELADEQDRPLLLFLHSNLPHDYGTPHSRDHYEACFPERRDWFHLGRRYLSWADLTAAERRRIRSLYDACVHRLDEQLSRVVDAVDLDTTIVCVTGDHGEGFDYELGRLHHGGRLHDDLINVPLLLHVPPSVDDDRRRRLDAHRSAPVSATDILPTLLDLAGETVPGGIDGVALGAADPDPRRVVVSEDRRYLYLPSRKRLNVNFNGKGTTRSMRLHNRVLEGSAARGHNLKAFVQGRHKLIVTSYSPWGGPLAAGAVRRLAPVGSTLVRSGRDWLALELFDVVADPQERHNLLMGRSGPDLLAFAREALPRLDDLELRVNGRPRPLVAALGGEHAAS